MSIGLRKVVIVCVLLILAGCATARVVSSQPGKGGVIAVNPPNDADARSKAEELMRANCHGKKFEIVEEGEAVIGTTSYGHENTSLSKSSLFSSTSQETENKTEWRMSYRCL